MSYNSERFGVRRSRSADGVRRHSHVLSIRDVSPLAEHRLGEIAIKFKVPRGRVFDAAMALIWSDLGFESTEAARSQETPISNMTWLLRKEERLSRDECPEIARLEDRLAESRHRRNQIMGREDQ